MLEKLPSLEEVIFNDMKEALKYQEKLRLSTLRMIRAAIKNAEISKREKLNENEIVAIIASNLKKVEESLDIFIKGQRPDLADNAKKEIEIIKEYLPEQLSEEEIKKVAQEIILKFNFKSSKDIGLVMREIMPQLKGKADGKLVNKIVKDLLNNLDN
jgi:hypothetical protein